MNRFAILLGKEPPPAKPVKKGPYFVGVDVGYRENPTQVALCHLENSDFIVDRVKQNDTMTGVLNAVINWSHQHKDIKIRIDNSPLTGGKVELKQHIENHDISCDIIKLERGWIKTLLNRCDCFRLNISSIKNLEKLDAVYLAMSLALEYRLWPEKKNYPIYEMIKKNGSFQDL
jgi:hypothetical protein